jgi:hypothetical protein
VVDDKDALMRRHAGKTLRATLAVPIATLPPELAAVGARLEANGLALAVDAAPGASFGPTLAAFARSGLRVQDVETRRMRLEDVFVSLLRGGGGEQGAAAAPRETP